MGSAAKRREIVEKKQEMQQIVSDMYTLVVHSVIAWNVEMHSHNITFSTGFTYSFNFAFCTQVDLLGPLNKEPNGPLRTYILGPWP